MSVFVCVLLLLFSSEKPICALRRFPNVCLWSNSNVRVTAWQWPSLVLSVKVFERFLFCYASLFQAIDGVSSLALRAPASSVSSSSTFQIFRDASLLWLLFFPAFCLLGHFPSLRRVQGSTPTGVSESANLGFPFYFSLFVAICEDDGMCVVWLSPLDTHNLSSGGIFVLCLILWYAFVLEVDVSALHWGMHVCWTSMWKKENSKNSFFIPMSHSASVFTVTMPSSHCFRKVTTESEQQW